MNAAHADQATARENWVEVNPLPSRPRREPTPHGNFAHRLFAPDQGRARRRRHRTRRHGARLRPADSATTCGNCALHGTETWGWDPVHLPDGSRAPAQVVNLGYVVNVIEDADERAECLACAWGCAERVLIVIGPARLADSGLYACRTVRGWIRDVGADLSEALSPERAQEMD